MSPIVSLINRLDAPLQLIKNRAAQLTKKQLIVHLIALAIFSAAILIGIYGCCRRFRVTQKNGSTDKKIKVLSSSQKTDDDGLEIPLKICLTELPFQTRTIPPIDPEHIAKVQQIIDDKGVPLNCRNPSPLTQLNHIKNEIIEAHLKSIQDDSYWHTIKKKMYDHLDKITFQELQSGVAICCEELNRLLVDKDYTLLFYRHKSQEWIAEMGIPQLTKAPDSFVWTETLCIYNITDQFISKNPTLVVFDDVSYSGKQLFDLIDAIDIQAEKDEKHYDLFLVVPFITERVKEVLKNKDVWKNSHINTHIITTNRKVSTLEDIFSEKQLLGMSQRELEDLRLPPSLIAKKDLQIPIFRKKSLTFSEWKIPDGTSMWDLMKDVKVNGSQESIFTSFNPPYY